MRQENEPGIVAVVRTAQIIVGALLAGCVTFMVVVLVVGGAPDDSAKSSMLTFIASGTAGVLVLVRFVVPSIVVAQARGHIRQGTWMAASGSPPAATMQQSDDTGKLIQVFMTRTILAAAIVEGGIFLLLVVYMTERSALSLALAVVLIAILASGFPTASRVGRWLEEQTRLLDEERSF